MKIRRQCYPFPYPGILLSLSEEKKNSVLLVWEIKCELNHLISLVGRIQHAGVETMNQGQCAVPMGEER